MDLSDNPKTNPFLELASSEPSGEAEPDATPEPAFAPVEREGRRLGKVRIGFAREGKRRR